MNNFKDFLDAYSLSKICKIVLEYTLKCSQLISFSDNKKILLTTRNVRLDSGCYALKYYYSRSWIILKVCLNFKISHFAGDSNDYMGVSIKDGGVALSINLGNGRLDTGIKNKNVRFDDDVWHHVVIFRVAQQVRM